MISTTIRSESTRVPPVTALRSPPASRMTGADSPVIADSSTEAMPSITVPSPGITSPASTTTTSPRRELGRGPRPPSRSRATVSVRIARSASACALPRPSASASARLAKTTVSQSQTRDREREPRGLVAAAERRAAEGLDQPADRRDHGADLDHEHHRVADLAARVELARSSRSQRPRDHRRSRACIGRRFTGASSSSVDIELEHVDARARRGRRGRGPSVFSSTSSRTRSSGIPRTLATRFAWIRAFAWRSAGRRPRPRSSPRRPGRRPPCRPGRVAALEGQVGLGLVAK